MRSWLPLVLSLLCGVCFADQQEDEQAIRSRINSYAEAFMKQDADALAGHWAEDAVYVKPLTGEELVGREEIRENFEEVFAEDGQAQLELTVDSIIFEDPDTAIEKGTATLVKDGKRMESGYTATHVKRDGKWFLNTVEEVDFDDAPSHYDKLKELEWLVGEWSDQDGELQFEQKCDWDQYKNFLTQTFKAKFRDREQFEARMIIGWDPANEQIHSWMFDSDGGFGNGIWLKEGDQWMVNFSQTMPDGRKASAINIYRIVNDHEYTWQSTGREVDGEILPNTEEITISRKGGMDK